MGFSSIQVCMDSPDWLQGPNSSLEDNNTTGLMDSSSLITTPTGDCDDILSCGRPMIERRLRPQHEQALQCPRCESTHTKFCYYNNYSLTQPRYFCKTCRRYWTKGGTLRNIPVGGGCRKNKKPSSSSKKPSSSTATTAAAGPDQMSLHRPSSSLLSSQLVIDHTCSRAIPTDLQLAFPEQLQFSSIHGPGLFSPANAGYLFENMGGPSPAEYMGSKYDHATSFLGSDMGMQNPSHDFHGMCSNVNHPLFGLASNYEHGIDNPSGGVGNILESCQRLMMPYDENHHHHHLDIHNHHHHHDQVDVKPNAKILSLEWHDCNSDAGIKDSFGYNLGGLGPWAGLMNGYGPPATNPLV